MQGLHIVLFLDHHSVDHDLLQNLASIVTINQLSSYFLNRYISCIVGYNFSNLDLYTKLSGIELRSQDSILNPENLALAPLCKHNLAGDMRLAPLDLFFMCSIYLPLSRFNIGLFYVSKKHKSFIVSGRLKFDFVTVHVFI